MMDFYKKFKFVLSVILIIFLSYESVRSDTLLKALNCPQCASDEFCFGFFGICKKCVEVAICRPGEMAFSREDCSKLCPDFLQGTTTPTPIQHITSGLAPQSSTDKQQKTTKDLEGATPAKTATPTNNQITTGLALQSSTDTNEKPKKTTTPVFNESDIAKTPINNNFMADNNKNSIPLEGIFIGVTTVLSAIIVVCIAYMLYLAWDIHKLRQSSRADNDEENISLQEVSISTGAKTPPLNGASSQSPTTPEESYLLQPDTPETPQDMAAHGVATQDMVTQGMVTQGMTQDMVEVLNEKICPNKDCGIFDRLDDCFDGNRDFLDSLARDGGVKQSRINDIYRDPRNNSLAAARHQVWSAWGEKKERRFIDIYNYKHMPHGRQDSLITIAKEHCRRKMQENQPPED